MEVSSWPGLTRPSTSFWYAEKKDVDARHKAGHDEPKEPRPFLVADYLSLGSSASRRPSPTRFSDSTTTKIASPGQIAIHGALVRKRCAALSMLPQDGAGGCWPSPRNDSAASAMIAAAIDSVACTRSAGRMLGRMWNSAMRQGGLPIARAAST